VCFELGLAPVQNVDTEKHFQMHSTPRLVDWFAVTDLNDEYFHVSILPQHRPFLYFRIAFSTLSMTGEKNKLSPMQRMSFLGIELDSLNMTNI